MRLGAKNSSTFGQIQIQGSNIKYVGMFLEAEPQEPLALQFPLFCEMCQTNSQAWIPSVFSNQELTTVQLIDVDVYCETCKTKQKIEFAEYRFHEAAIFTLLKDGQISRQRARRIVRIIDQNLPPQDTFVSLEKEHPAAAGLVAKADASGDPEKFRNIVKKVLLFLATAPAAALAIDELYDRVVEGKFLNIPGIERLDPELENIPEQGSGDETGPGHDKKGPSVEIRPQEDQNRSWNNPLKDI